MARGAYGPRHGRRGSRRDLQMLDVYAEFAEEHMAMPVVKGAKTA